MIRRAWYLKRRHPERYDLYFKRGNGDIDIGYEAVKSEILWKRIKVQEVYFFHKDDLYVNLSKIVLDLRDNNFFPKKTGVNSMLRTVFGIPLWRENVSMQRIKWKLEMYDFLIEKYHTKIEQINKRINDGSE
jgi:hypothetical protein